jgi:hypothetical protein
MFDEITAIRKVAIAYLDGLYNGDADSLAALFHPEGSLSYFDDGKLTIISRDQWLEVVRKRPSPKARSLSRHDDILHLDQSSDKTAFIKLRCAVPPRFYNDYLCLIKTGGNWLIVQKVFATEIHN